MPRSLELTKRILLSRVSRLFTNTRRTGLNSYAYNKIR